MNKFNHLINLGWKQEPEIPFKEKVAFNASSCYTYHNSIGSYIAIMPVSNDSSVLIRLSGGSVNQFTYFKIELNNNEESIISGVNNAKEMADINNYFSFYFELQSTGDASIVAWEQWETHYR